MNPIHAGLDRHMVEAAAANASLPPTTMALHLSPP